MPNFTPVSATSNGGAAASMLTAYRALVSAFRRTPTPAPRQSISGPLAFLSSEHDIHAQWMPWWSWVERAMKGGPYMQDLLRRFDWETCDGESYDQRKRTATYINWPDLYATALTGHMMRNGPTPDLGGLGKITENSRPLGSQTRADAFYFNVDRVGLQGSEWPTWWMARGRSAMAYGHTWIMTESASRRPVTRADEFRGTRPYLVEWRPSYVWDWHFEDGALQYAIIRYYARNPRMDATGVSTGQSLRYYLMTRKGWDAWGPEFAGGGFWVYDDKGTLVTNRTGDLLSGNFDSLDGEIPLNPLYHLRDDGTEETPAMSRSGVAELAALGESFMNVSSAADFEVWDSAKGMEYFMGVTADAFNLAMAKITEGSRFVPVPGSNSGGNANPTVQAANSGGTASAVFKERLDAKREDAETYSALTSNTGPDASGRAREADFANTKGPILSLFAAEMQAAQNQVIYNVQRRWGIQSPSGGVIWPRKFELVKAQEAIRDVFDAASLIGAQSPTLMAVGVARLCAELGVVSDETILKTIHDEIQKNGESTVNAASRLAELRSRGDDTNDPANGGGNGGGGA